MIATKPPINESWPKWIDWSAAVLLTAAGAECVGAKEAHTRSVYCHFRTADGRSATIRDADHGIHHPWIGFGPIPRLHAGCTINIGDRQREIGLKLLAVFLGWPPAEVRQYRLSTQRGVKALIETPRESFTPATQETAQ
jgi:hypothetical protein